MDQEAEIKILRKELIALSEHFLCQSRHLEEVIGLLQMQGQQTKMLTKAVLQLQNLQVFRVKEERKPFNPDLPPTVKEQK